MAQPPGIRYRERVWPSFGVWFGAVFVLVMIDVAVGAGLGIPTGIGVALLTTATALYWLVAASPIIEVTATDIHAGRAHIALTLIDNVVALDSAAARDATGRDADGRTYLVTRGWVTSAVRFDITDETDPTPDWIVSTRHADELATTLEQARRSAIAGRTAG
jgi:uncharacterized membrane protein YhaH (DUF805 family)